MGGCLGDLFGGSGRCRRASSSSEEGCDRATMAQLERADGPIWSRGYLLPNVVPDDLAGIQQFGTTYLAVVSDLL